ncbi:MAG: hypothetical protein QF441_06100 [Bacteriovoracaceae bacterium]|jgi:hypothetical protein|nr:hypothetical protein [Halobacteriovoraceae bacterium]MDP7320161.1 hypothetical protein [Bacteriovoracaceae bacterium]|tara:strand:+ start:239 stop:628 length:390 start_codon:yes stop_codon:yes gene_type:complete
MKKITLVLFFNIALISALSAATFQDGNYIGTLEGSSNKCELKLNDIGYSGGYATYNGVEYGLIKASSSSAANCPLLGEDHTRYVGFQFDEQGKEIEICVSNSDQQISQVLYEQIVNSRLIEQESCLNLQ